MANRNLEFKSAIDARFGGNRELIVGYNFLKGTVRFVDSNVSGGVAGNGLSWDAAHLTIDAAINASKADDVILVAPAHAETLSAAAGIDADVAGLTIIGLGSGSRRPTITMGTVTTVDVDIDAAGITFENLLFLANFADIVAAIDVNATDFTIRNCEFREASALNFLVCIQDAAAAGSDRMSILGCRANCTDAANTHFVNFAGTGDGHRVQGNVLYGDWGTMAIGGAGIVTNCAVLDNVVANIATDTDAGINFAATATGFCMRNLVGTEAAQANQITAGDMVICENYGAVRTEDLSGILEPAGT